MICLKLATRTGSFQVEVDATPADCGVANINYERKPLAVPGTRNTGTNYADSRYQLPQIDTITAPGPRFYIKYSLLPFGKVLALAVITVLSCVTADRCQGSIINRLRKPQWT